MTRKLNLILVQSSDCKFYQLYQMRLVEADLFPCLVMLCRKLCNRIVVNRNAISFRKSVSCVFRAPSMDKHCQTIPWKKKIFLSLCMFLETSRKTRLLSYWQMFSTVLLLTNFINARRLLAWLWKLSYPHSTCYKFCCRGVLWKAIADPLATSKLRNEETFTRENNHR